MVYASNSRGSDRKTVHIVNITDIIIIMNIITLLFYSLRFGGRCGGERGHNMVYV